VDFFDLHQLMQPQGGLFGESTRFRTQGDEPRLAIRTIQLGAVSQVCPNVKNRRHFHGALAAAGVGLDDAESTLPALGEALERYCACIYSEEQFISATAIELGSDALDLDTVARCSKTELSHPKCPLVVPDKKQPMQWVAGVSLLDGRRIYVPAALVYLFPAFAAQAERFWFPITTGCAAHVSYERALINAILEVIERDAISLIWLQKLALPRIEIDHRPLWLAEQWESYQSNVLDVEYFFFDGTTDIGIPTVYALQISPANRRLTTLVACSTTMSAADAVTKVMRDMAAARIAFRPNRPIPKSVEDFTDIFHGATYMARAEQAPAFDFLMGSGRTRRLSEMPTHDGAGDMDTLQRLLQRLRSKRLEVFAVDLTTDEAVRCGMRVVRVLIPALQPLSFHYRARYLGHPRLYRAPADMGYPVHEEEQLNAWPQPFA